MPRVNAFVVLVVAVVTACHASTSPRGDKSIGADSPIDSAAMSNFREKFVRAYNADDTAALARLYTSSATYIGTAGDVVTGRDRIQFGLGRELPVLTNFALQPQELGGGRDCLYERGTYSQKLEIPGQPAQQLTGKYLVALKREDAEWRVHMQMVSRDR